MAKRHREDEPGKDSPTENGTGKDETTEPAEPGSLSRRTVLKTASAAAVALGAGAFAGSANAAEFTASPSGEVHVSPGEYTWESLDIGSGDALIGDGNPGDVVLNLESGTMDGSIEGHLENVVVRGSNPNSKAGLDLYPGAVVDGFVWPEGGQQSEDRAFYTPNGGNDRLTVRNSAWANMVNNGAYIDKPPVTMENCAAINNNISGIRVGHRDGTDESETTYIRNCLIAVVDDIGHDDTNSPNARGLRLRHPAHLVVENCWFVYLDVSGTANPIELHDGAAGATVEIRDCHFYHDASPALVRDKSGGSVDVTIENCTVEGSGSRTVEPDYSGSGLSEASKAVPLPSAITGYAAADDVPGVDAGSGPWGDGSSAPADTTQDQPQPDGEHTLVLHASPDNPVSSSATPGDYDLDVTVSGSAVLDDGADGSIVQNGDGTTTVDVNNLLPDEMASIRFDGEVVSYAMDDGYDVDVSLDGTTTTLEDLVNGGSGDGSAGGSNDGSSDGSTTDSSGGSSDGSSSGSGDGSTSASSDGSSGSPGDGSADSALPHRITIDGQGAKDVTRYTFTVSGDVARDAAASEQTADGTPWDRLEDIAENGKVIGLVGSGVDAYRFDGNLASITVDGDATFTIDRNV